MSEEMIVNETLSLVKDAQSQGTFNLADVIKGRGYPTKEVSVYTDVDAAFKLYELEKQLENATNDVYLYKLLDDEAQALAKVVQASKLTFTMRGISQAEVERITAITDELAGELNEDSNPEEWSKQQACGLVAANIIRVTDADGKVDEHLFTREEVVELRGLLPSDAWSVLVATMQKLTLATGFFDGLTDAGFLPKS